MPRIFNTIKNSDRTYAALFSIYHASGFRHEPISEELVYEKMRELAEENNDTLGPRHKQFVNKALSGLRVNAFIKTVRTQSGGIKFTMEKTLTDIFSDYVDRERGPARFTRSNQAYRKTCEYLRNKLSPLIRKHAPTRKELEAINIELELQLSEHKRMCVLAHRLRSPSLVMTEIVTGDSRSDSFSPTEIYEHAAERTTMSGNESMYISAPGPCPEPKTPSRGTSTLSDPSRAYPTPGTGRPRRETNVAPSAFNANNPSTPTPPGSFYASANSFNNNSIAHLSSSPLHRQPTLLDLERDRLSSDYDRQEEEIARLKRHITIVAAHYEKYKTEREKTVAIREAQIKELESRLEEQEKILAEMQQKITQETAFSRQKSADLQEFEAKYQDLRQKFLTYRDQHTSWLNALPKLPSDLD